MRENLAGAAKHFGLTVTGEPRHGWQDRSISALVIGHDERLWLRVVSEDRQWTEGEFWTGNLEANAFSGLFEPHVVDVYEWEHERHQRAELMTLVPGSPCGDVLHHPDDWWAELRRTTKSIATMPTTRVNADQALVTGRIQQQFGNAVNPVVHEWETVHGDLHWANLMAPRFALLDWKSWGRGPKGTDAATLLSHSLLVPHTAERVRDTFADVLTTDAGLIAQFYVAAQLLHRIDRGDHAELAAPLRRHINSL
ncbi:aminoglycoside phosphotransferase [Lentzea sp. NPDC058436]|uniref:aminoglycoside phosphotransferase n=1 Tax=Lentzea sp. NPDC058436 TaxID=3346499 RepID=UPI003658A294